MKIIRKRGDTSNILQIFIQDSSSTVGAGLTGLTNATAGLTAYYHKDSDTTATAISLVTMTVGTFTSSGFKEIDATNMPGWYQFCPPDAAFSTTGTPHSVAFHLKGATNMAPLPIECQLVAVDVEDTVRLGLTALPNVASGSAGAIPTTGTGANQISVSGGAVTVGTNNDKTGYSLTQTFPTNFSALAITVGGAVTAGTVSDKTGYSLSQTFPTNFSALAITAGGAVTAGTVSDKTGYSLSQAFPANFASTSIDASGNVATTSNVKKNTAKAGFMFVMTDSTTHAPKTGVAVTATRSLDGAAFAACTNAVTEVGTGTYVISLSAADTNADHVMLRFTGASADDLNIELVTQP